MQFIKAINLLLRFLLELCILVILGYWGFRTGRQTILKVGLGIGVPVSFAVLWGTFLAPASSMRLQMPWLLIAELLIFGIAGIALYSTGHPSLALVFVLLYIVNRILMQIWGQ